MAVVYAVVNGNWGTGTTWNTGTVPTAADDVYADGKTVTIDTGFTVNTLNTTQRAGGTNGGGFSCSTNGITITANINCGGGTVTLNTNITGTLNIIGSFSIPNINTCTGLVHGNNGTINITGNISGGTGINTWGITYGGLNGLVNITGNVFAGGNAFSPTIMIGSQNRLIVTGNITGGIAGTTPAISNSSISSTSVIINGNLISGSYSAIVNGSTGTVTINNSLIPSGTTGVYAISNSSSGIININGDCLGSLSGTPSTALIVNNLGAGIVNINGSVIQRSIGPSASIGIVNNASTGTININGNVGGGTVASSIGVSNSSTGTINVTGSVSGGTNATMTPAIYSTTAGIITVTGNTISGLHPAIYSTSTTAIHRLYGNLVSANGIFPIYGLTIRISPSVAQTITLQDTSNVSRAFDTSTTTTGLPAASNVRIGTSYGNINQYSGTMYVPTPDNVRKDVLTDNTVGTADLSVTSLIDTLTGSTNPMAVRLRNVSTAQITGSQISGLLNNP